MVSSANPLDELAQHAFERDQRRQIQEHRDVTLDVALPDEKVDVDEQHAVRHVRAEGPG